LEKSKGRRDGEEGGDQRALRKMIRREGKSFFKKKERREESER
jgi:hypothetical protein